MKWLLLSTVCGALLFLAPGCAHAQLEGCGQTESIHVECNAPCNSSMYVYWFVGPGEGDNRWIYQVTVQCGGGQGCTQRLEDSAPAGYCYPDEVSKTLSTRDVPVNVADTVDGVIRTLATRNAPVNAEDAVYVDAYVRDCKGQYVVMRVAI